MQTCFVFLVRDRDVTVREEGPKIPVFQGWFGFYSERSSDKRFAGVGGREPQAEFVWVRFCNLYMINWMELCQSSAIRMIHLRSTFHKVYSSDS